MVDKPLRLALQDILPPSIQMHINAIYYPNWAVYRNKPPSSLNLGVISHVFYAFAKLLPDGSIGFTDEWADLQMDVDGTKGCLRSFVKLKEKPGNTHVKVILSIGGAGEGSKHFYDVAKDGYKRPHFARSCRQICDQFGLDGIDIDWEHPTDRAQGLAYVHMLFDLRAALPRPHYTLTTALPAGEWVLRHINFTQSVEFLDLLNVMAYDFTGPWTDKSGHHAQLFSPHDKGAASAHAGIDYLLQSGMRAEQLLLGVPIYGRSFLGAHAPGQPYMGHGGDEGTFLYSELPRHGAQECFDEKHGAAYCVGGDGGFVTYDNPQSVQLKARYARSRGLGGLFYWSSLGDADGQRSLITTGYLALHSDGP